MPRDFGRLKIALIALVALAAFGLPSFAEFYTDWLWYGEVGYRQVFLKSLSARAQLSAVAGLLAAGAMFATLRVALGTLRRRDFEILTPDGPRTLSVDPGNLRPLVAAGALVVGVIFGGIAGSRWEDWLLFAQSQHFTQADPVLGWNVGFYVFQLPFLRFAQGMLLGLLVVVAATLLVVHVLAGNVGMDPIKGVFSQRRATQQLAAVAGLLLLVLAAGAWLSIPSLLTHGTGIVHGASYVDVHASIPAYRVLMVASVVGALLAWYQMLSARLWPLGAAVALYVVTLVGGIAYGAIIQRFVVAPNEQVQQTPFIAHNIAGTRAAFGLEGVEERQLTGDAALTRADIDRNAATLGNVPLWNHQPLLDSFGQLQEIRTYYDFVSVDNDRYMINGEYRQIMLSARELNSESLPSRTWINERLTFTHGYGVTLGPVNQATREGLPVLYIKNLPPESSVDLKVTEPAIYFGELSSDHVFVNTATEEFDYPKGDDNVFAAYRGTGGIALGNLGRRLLFALRFGSTDTFFSPTLLSESRVLLHRRIAERVSKIAPFLALDPDPYLAISDGRLVWIQDAYTVSREYPYSTPIQGGLNYIRNSIKVTVDAYHGTTRFYLVDPSDPIAAGFAEVFPDLLRPLTEMPEDLRNRLRYPQRIFSIQASVFSTFHMTNAAVFYNREDQWEVPVVDGGAQAARIEPYYTIMKLPGEQSPEFIQMLPFTPRQKDNLAAWMVARSDGANYGKLVVFQFPKQTVVYGPRQVAARINQDQIISPQITLWNQQGSEVIQGSLLVIPIEESLIYIRPLYLRAAGGRIPEMTRVIVAYQNQIVMEDTLEAALARLFPVEGRRAPSTGAAPTGASSPAAPGATSESDTAAGGELAAQARDLYRRALEAQRAGEWARYGELITRLGQVLEQMNQGGPGGR
jgi:uncharacterized membrane protein (UPF0182 family)